MLVIGMIMYKGLERPREDERTLRKLGTFAHEIVARSHKAGGANSLLTEIM